MYKVPVTALPAPIDESCSLEISHELTNVSTGKFRASAGDAPELFVAPEQHVERPEPRSFMQQANVLRAQVFEGAADQDHLHACPVSREMCTLTRRAPGTGVSEAT